MHSHRGRSTGTAVVEGEGNPELGLDMDEVDRVIQIHQPALTFLCSPNNPPGMLEPGDAVTRVLELGSGVVVVDEAYGQFAPGSAVDLVSDDRPLVVVRTFSKTWSMAGARLGYLIGPPEI